MKLKQKVDMIIDAILIVIGIVMLMLPTFKITDIKNLFFTIMILYAILNFIQFILTLHHQLIHIILSTTTPQVDYN